MQKMQKGTISGSVYATERYSSSEDYKTSRMPTIGQTVEFDDGRKFVFVSSKIALLAGNVVAVSTALATPIDNLIAATEPIGETEIVMTTAGVTFFGGTVGVNAADRFAEGYLVTNDDAGEGYCYRIKGNTASTALTTTTFTLYDGLKVALTVASDVFILGPRYRMVAQGTATLPPVGIAVVPCTGTSEYYFWAQTKGICGVTSTTGTNQAIGTLMVAAASGGVDIGTGHADIPIGIALGTDTTATATVPVQLTIGG